MICFKAYEEPVFRENEILRYAGCREADSGVAGLLSECISEVRPTLVYKVCFRTLRLKTDGAFCDFGAFGVNSEKLAANLKGCETAVVFAATIGVGIDRLIAKYGRISPSKALMLQAIGAERIEALCDSFCSDIETDCGMGTRPRFSPGYGDFPLECQRDIFRLLDCERKIGLTLNDSLLMSPSKSVTAVVGIGGKGGNTTNKCGSCGIKSCIFRGTL